jgi:hypothetical protein
MIRTKIFICLAALATLAAATLTFAGPAAAFDPYCTVQAYGDHCVFWSQSYGGAHAGDPGAVPDWIVYNYPNNGTGQGGHIGNNNGSDRNVDTVCHVRLWYNPNYGGYEVTLNPYGTSGYQRAGSGLGHLLNNLRSQNWYC